MWQAWLADRKARRKVVSEHAARLQMKNLAALGPKFTLPDVEVRPFPAVTHSGEVSDASLTSTAGLSPLRCGWFWFGESGCPSYDSLVR